MTCNFSANKINQVKAQKAENWTEELKKRSFKSSKKTKKPCRESSHQQVQKSKQESEKRQLWRRKLKSMRRAQARLFLRFQDDFLALLFHQLEEEVATILVKSCSDYILIFYFFFEKCPIFVRMFKKIFFRKTRNIAKFYKLPDFLENWSHFHYNQFGHNPKWIFRSSQKRTHKRPRRVESETALTGKMQMLPKQSDRQMQCTFFWSKYCFLTLIFIFNLILIRSKILAIAARIPATLWPERNGVKRWNSEASTEHEIFKVELKKAVLKILYFYL